MSVRPQAMSVRPQAMSVRGQGVSEWLSEPLLESGVGVTKAQRRKSEWEQPAAGRSVGCEGRVGKQKAGDDETRNSEDDKSEWGSHHACLCVRACVRVCVCACACVCAGRAQSATSPCSSSAFSLRTVVCNLRKRDCRSTSN
eukprot:212107-Pleurochrysis_carterae.AAC.2